MKRRVTNAIMFRLVFLTLVVCSLLIPDATRAEEIALIDSKGEYAAYMTEMGIIYLWEGGDPPAYLDGESIYSFDGKHLGWFLKGYIVDHNGYKVGAVEGIVKSSSLIKPFKGLKGLVPLKSLKEMAPMKTQILNAWSSIPLGTFLQTGIAIEKGTSVSSPQSPKPLSLLQGSMKLKEILSDSEYRKSGLHKLTPAELANLEKVIATMIYVVVGTAQQNSAVLQEPPTVQGTSDVIESRIDGTFEGWSGETIFKLVNGQIWQQAAYAYTYHYAYRPKVLIYKATGGYQMKVEGVDQTISVRQIK